MNNAHRKEAKIRNRVCRKAYGRHVLRLKIRLARASGSRDFWKLTKHLSGMSTRKRTATPLPQALADYFAAKMSLPGEENKQVPPLEQLPDGAKRLRSFKLTHAMVAKVLRSLNELKSVGPDGVSPRLLKHCAKELVRQLTDLFQKVTRAAEFLKSWKVARVTPV